MTLLNEAKYSPILDEPGSKINVTKEAVGYEGRKEEAPRERGVITRPREAHIQWGLTIIDRSPII
jgi:hypothetical protein